MPPAPAIASKGFGPPVFATAAEERLHRKRMLAAPSGFSRVLDSTKVSLDTSPRAIPKSSIIFGSIRSACTSGRFAPRI